MNAGAGPPHASVAVSIPSRRLFAYSVPDHLAPRVRTGCRVRVPFGRRKVVGTVVEFPAPRPDGIETRPIESILDRGPSLEPEIVDLTRFVAEYYLCSWGTAIDAALPPDPGPGRPRRMIRRLPGGDPELLPARATARRRVLAALPADGAEMPLGRLPERDRRVAAKLAKLGLVEIVESFPEPGAPEPEAPAAEPPPRLEPTPGQAAALDTLLPVVESGGYAPFLLYGATGSGKTEVYLRAAEATLARGKGVLYLVPEIGLTPLLASRLRARFGGEVSVLHSGLGRRDRYDAWERVRRGTCRFVVGTRSAVFTPVRDLGLIVVDEEHDGSYKQEETPRYNGRDLAILRARESEATIVLGSATPSLESFQHCRAGRYSLIRLGGRVENRPLPAVDIVDMREEFRHAGDIRPVSRRLQDALIACLERGEQALVLRNRRGWSVAVFCPACGNRVYCKDCSVTMTWHRSARRLRCHTCFREIPAPKLCPHCGGDDLRYLGEGSERIEDELRVALPGARVARMDRDTVRRRGAHEALLRRFARGEIDVLVGTQMIAKGHDFPRVTVVGVLSADQSLGLPDFRAGERTFQLLTQVAGRAGRGERPGRVILQVFEPDHPVLREAMRHDYERFFERESDYRRTLRFPPFSAVVQLLVSDRDPGVAADRAELLADAVRRAGSGRLIVAGPGPAPVERIKGRFRWQILVRSAGRRRLVGAVDRALASVEKTVPLRSVVVDVDPYSLL